MNVVLLQAEDVMRVLVVGQVYKKAYVAGCPGCPRPPPPPPRPTQPAQPYQPGVIEQAKKTNFYNHVSHSGYF